MVDYIFDAHLRSLLDHYDFYVMPCVNPDGYEFSHSKVCHLTSIHESRLGRLTLYNELKLIVFTCMYRSDSRLVLNAQAMY